MSKLLNFKRIAAANILAALLIFTGCVWVDEPANPSQDNLGHVKMHVGVDGVNAETVAGTNVLGKTSTISLSKLIVVLTSSANDTIRDTITSSTSPALSTTSTSAQTITKNYSLKPLRTWKMVAKVKDTKDSLIHQDSATTSVLKTADTTQISLNLSSRFIMYAANFILPDSISSATAGSTKDILNINRLVLKIDTVVRMDSSKTYFTPNATSTLSYDYVPLASAGWLSVTGGASKFWYGVHFPSANMGYIAGDTAIFKTTDGGTNWTSQTIGNYKLRTVYFADTNTGYAAGFSGVIVKTTDGGANWNAQTSGTAQNLFSTYFSNATKGYTVGATGTILKTSNGGTNWTTQTSGTTNYLYSVYFTDSATGYAVGLAGTILKTTNGGTNWTAQTSGTTNDLFAVHFPSAQTGYAVGSATILKTTNGGTSWTMQTSGSSQILRSVYFTDVNTGYAVGSDGTTILKTTDGGTNWITQTSGTSQYLRCINFYGSSGYAVGDGGTILRLLPTGSHLIQLYAYGPMHTWNTANPLFTGSKVITVGAGQDSTVSFNLGWAGPTTGTGSLTVTIGKVGKITLIGKLPGS